MSHLEAEVVVRRPAHTLDVRLHAEPGDVIALIGPNGTGKSTFVRALAGIVPLSAGSVRVGTRTWEAPPGRRLLARQRGVGMVFQSELLFPHLSALGNVAFGPRSRGVPRRAAERAARGWLDRLGIGDLAERRPHQLSGGQAQRVSLARALVVDPDLLLLDEPLSALDVSVATALRIELAGHLATFGGIAVLVTHDALDAMTIANRVLVLDQGLLAQEGTPEEVSARPRTEHVARLVGLNVLHGTSAGTVVELADGSRLTSVSSVYGLVNACFSPAAVTLTLQEPAGSARNHWAGRVASLSPHGAAVRVQLDCVGGLIADVTPGSAATLGLVPGRAVWASVKATEVRVYGASG